MVSTRSGDVMRLVQSFMNALARSFPMPEVLMPRTAGVDISDASIKWVVLKGQRRGELTLESWGEVEIPDGVVVSGAVHDIGALARSLGQVRGKIAHVQAAHAALPEEAAFTYSMGIPRGSSRQQILSRIEFDLDTRVPIPLAQAVYDFTKIPDAGEGEQEEIGVVAFPRELAESYAAAFDGAGFSLLSLELEARSTARAAVADTPKEPVVLLVDFGGTRTGLAVVKRAIPIFTSTVDIGGRTITGAILREASLKESEIDAWKNECGLDSSADDPASQKTLEAISGIASSLGDEIARHYRYWDTRRDEKGERVSPVSRVVLVGGSANLHGLPEYVSSRVQAPASRPNVWQLVTSFDSYVPPLDSHTALQYATAIGLALRAY
jgi:type IV pilus assembly protein PilM